jgi:hypothetical protein
MITAAAQRTAANTLGAIGQPLADAHGSDRSHDREGVPHGRQRPPKVMKNPRPMCPAGALRAGDTSSGVGVELVSSGECLMPASGHERCEESTADVSGWCGCEPVTPAAEGAWNWFLQRNASRKQRNILRSNTWWPTLDG